MKKQLLLIHGGNIFPDRKDFLNDLKNKEITLEKILHIGWKQNLARDLGDGYQVVAPRMPSSDHARYAEWKIMFEKILPLMDDRIILVGHSLGAIFLIKYLLEENIGKDIPGLFLVAGPVLEEDGETLGDFLVDIDNAQKDRLADKVFIYHSQDDPVVPYFHAELLQQRFTDAALRTFTDRQHLNMSDFPELVADIKNLS